MFARINPNDAPLLPELTVDDFRQLIERGVRVKCVDARDLPDPSAMKIPGAFRIRVEGGADVDRLPRDRHLVVYAAADDDARAAALARLLVTRGFSAGYLRGGFDAWLAAGFPVTTTR
jgi:rhodanese-related sulfurtransferase